MDGLTKALPFDLMRRTICTLCLVCVISMACALELAKESSLPIIYAEDAAQPGTTAFLCKTAEKLQTAIRQTVGAQLQVMGSTAVRQQPTQAIYIGKCKLLEELGKTPNDFQNFDYLIAEAKGSLLLAGFDGPCRKGLEAARNHGSIILGSTRAAVVFMERFLETRFLAPGETGTDYAKKDLVVIPNGFRLEGTNNLNYALGREPDFFYDYANGLHGAGRFLSHGGHSWYEAVPKQVYAKSHPEYFAQTGNSADERDSNRNHLCIGNPEVQELIYKQLLKDLDSGADIAQLAQTDAMVQCRCDLCRAMPGWSDPGEWIWCFHRSLAERLLKERPNKKVLIICYFPNWEPPKSFKDFPANTAVELCKYDEKTFEKWKGYKVPQGFQIYLYNWGEYIRCGMTPKRTPRFCAEQARRFINFGVKGIYRCGFGENFGMEGPSYYVYGKVLEDPSRDEKQLVNEYVERAYHESAKPMKHFYDTLYEHLEAFPHVEYIVPAREIVNMLYPPEVLDLLERHLKRAETMATGDKVKRRLLLVRTEFEYAKKTARALTLYTAYRTAPSKPLLDVLLNALDERKAFIDSRFTSNGVSIRLPGWKEVTVLGGRKHHLVQNGRLSALITAPFLWDTAQIRKNGVLPGTQVKRLEIPFADGNVAFDDFEKGAWAKAEWQQLNGIQLEKLSEQTWFKMVWDKDRLYVAVKAELASGRKHTPVGRDGTFWHQDAIELMIDPEGERELCYHLAWNPQPDSWYDSAKGLVKDPLNPNYGQEDVSWNGTWSYQTRREGNVWYSMAALPFKDFGVQPTAGAIWTLNVGREIRTPAQAAGTGQEELGLWAPNLSSLDFSDVNAFGEAEFK